ncbi:MAG: hypothetical protein MZV65_53055 [Chromatiales bacterium]|nr:hypothetical protein [Chromatiales bacterium]
MNVPFTLHDAALDEAVPQGRQGSAAWCSSKGHRSVGGMRASIYNAMPIEGVQALVDLHAASSSAARLSTAMSACPRS